MASNATVVDTNSRPFPWRQLPPGVDPLTDPRGFFAWADSVADPRVASWPLMSSPIPTMLICLAYILFVIFGMRFMRNRAPLDSLRPVMVVYNVVVIGINVYMAQAFIRGALESNYKIVCNSVDYSEKGAWLAQTVWVFYMSKLLDFCDTVFMILRKKFDQVTFLHVYHHCSMFFIWWHAVKYAAGGDGISGPIMNCFVHIVMYCWYLAALLRIPLPYKQIVTQIQLLQFFLLMWHSLSTIYYDCNYPHWTLYAQIIFCTSLVVLFGNFYFRAYILGRRRGAAARKAAATAAAAAAGAASKDAVSPPPAAGGAAKRRGASKTRSATPASKRKRSATPAKKRGGK